MSPDTSGWAHVAPAQAAHFFQRGKTLPVQPLVLGGGVVLRKSLSGSDYVNVSRLRGSHTRSLTRYSGEGLRTKCPPRPTENHPRRRPPGRSDRRPVPGPAAQRRGVESSKG